jgi:hypothetical protein
MDKDTFSPHRSPSLFRPRVCHDASCERERGWRRYWPGAKGVFLHDDQTWYCSPGCLQKALGEAVEKYPATARRSAPARRLPLGLMMLSRGHLTAEQLHAALKAQSARGGPLGGWLEKLGYASEQQVTAALGLQWACPILPALAAHHLECARMLPFPLLQHLRVLPVWQGAQKGTLCVAFCDGVNYAALNAVGEILRCRAEPCLVSSSVMDGGLAQLARHRSPGDMFFESDCSAYEIARIVAGYCQKLNAGQVRLANFRRFLWVRLVAGGQMSNLLFQRAVANPLSSAVFAGPLDGSVPARMAG